MKYCEKKISFANKNKELQNINETEQIKQCFCNTYFPWPWPYLLMYLQCCFSQVWACYTVFPFVFLFQHVSLCGTVLTWGRSQGTGVCTTGLDMPPWKWCYRSQLIQAPSLSRGMWVDCFYSLALKHACFHFINKCVWAVFAQDKEVVNMNIYCLFLSMCTLL